MSVVWLNHHLQLVFKKSRISLNYLRIFMLQNSQKTVEVFGINITFSVSMVKCYGEF